MHTSHDVFICLISSLSMIESGLKRSITTSSLKAEEEAPYRTCRGGQPVHIHPSSVLFSSLSGRKLPDYVVYAEVLITSKQYMRGVTAIEGAWLPELVPSLFMQAGAKTASGNAIPSSAAAGGGGGASGGQDKRKRF